MDHLRAFQRRNAQVHDGVNHHNVSRTTNRLASLAYGRAFTTQRSNSTRYLKFSSLLKLSKCYASNAMMSFPDAQEKVQRDLPVLFSVTATCIDPAWVISRTKRNIAEILKEPPDRRSTRCSSDKGES